MNGDILVGAPLVSAPVRAGDPLVATLVTAGDPVVFDASFTDATGFGELLDGGTATLAGTEFLDGGGI